MKTSSLTDIAYLNLLQFAKTDILINTAQKAERNHNLLRAMLLNYDEHQPVKIYFRNKANEMLCIECAVIAVTEEHIMLKSGIIVPVQSIVIIDLL